MEDQRWRCFYFREKKVCGGDARARNFADGSEGPSAGLFLLMSTRDKGVEEKDEKRREKDELAQRPGFARTGGGAEIPTGFLWPATRLPST